MIWPFSILFKKPDVKMIAIPEEPEKPNFPTTLPNGMEYFSINEFATNYLMECGEVSLNVRGSIDVMASKNTPVNCEMQIEYAKGVHEFVAYDESTNEYVFCHRRTTLILNNDSYEFKQVSGLISEGIIEEHDARLAENTIKKFIDEAIGLYAKYTEAKTKYAFFNQIEFYQIEFYNDGFNYLVYPRMLIGTVPEFLKYFEMIKDEQFFAEYRNYVELKILNNYDRRSSVHTQTFEIYSYEKFIFNNEKSLNTYVTAKASEEYLNGIMERIKKSAQPNQSLPYNDG